MAGLVRLPATGHVQVGTDEELTASLIADNRILLAVTPTRPITEWSVPGVEA
jgi:hypothetical protein